MADPAPPSQPCSTREFRGHVAQPWCAVYWSIWRKHLKIALTPSTARAASIRFGAGNFAYLVAIGIVVLSASASLLISELVAVYYVLEQTPARSGEALPGYSPVPGTSGGRQLPAEVVRGSDEYRPG